MPRKRNRCSIAGLQRHIQRLVYVTASVTLQPASALRHASAEVMHQHMIQRYGGPRAAPSRRARCCCRRLKGVRTLGRAARARMGKRKQWPREIIQHITRDLLAESYDHTR